MKSWFWLLLLISTCGYSQSGSIRESDSLRSRANQLRNQGDFQESKRIYDLSIVMSKSHGYELGVSKTYNSKSTLYRRIGKFDSASLLLNEAIVINESNQFISELVKNYVGLGNLNYAQSEYSVAESFYRKVLQLAKSKIKNLPDNQRINLLGNAYNGLGLVMLKGETESSLRKALDQFKMAKSFYGEAGNSVMTVSVLRNFGVAYEELHELDSALHYYFKVYEFSSDNEYLNQKAEVCINIGNVYYQSKDYEKAKSWFLHSTLIENKVGNVLARKNAFLRLTDTFIMLNKGDSALLFFSKYRIANDSIYHSDLAQNLAEQEERFKNKKLISSIDSEIKRSEKLRLFLISALAIIVIVAILLIYIRQKQRLALKESELAKTHINDLLKQQEILSLQGVLAGQEEERKRIAGDLHDKLGAILGMVKLHFSAVEERIDTLRDDNKHQYDKANDLLDQASEEVRNISHNLVSGVLTKFGLVPALNDLKDKIESTGKLKVQLLINEMGERLSGEKELQLYRIVQELVSNILKHAKATSATIQLNRQNGTLNLIVEDDGIGFDTDRANRKTGMGMQNLQARVDQLNGTLHYDSGKGSGTTVSIDIPIVD